MTAIKDLMLETFEVSKVLIIAPLRVARDTWPAEIEKWDHLQGLDISVIVGDTKTRIAALHHPAMIYVINRENIKWLVEYYEKNGMRWDFGMVVIDELSSFKNYQSQRFKFLRKVRPYVKRWVGLTGTPSSNGLMDLWAEIGILDGGERLGKFIGRYREAYFKASSMNPSTGVVFQYKPREGAEELIYQRISDITISMKALDYLHMANRNSPIITVIPMSSKLKKLELPVHIPVTGRDCEMLRDEGLEESILLVEQITTIDKMVLCNRLCRVTSAKKKQEIEAAVKKQFAMQACMGREAQA